MTHLLIDKNNVIINSIVLDEATGWAPPDGLRVVTFVGVWLDGWVWDGEKAIDPNAKEPEPEPTGFMRVL